MKSMAQRSQFSPWRSIMIGMDWYVSGLHRPGSRGETKGEGERRAHIKRRQKG